ncbi:MAG: hypothetical protein JWO79_3582 [Actinomycetia bacterium]|nr:hypothetical protein [Actinomycetes bacterium]
MSEQALREIAGGQHGLVTARQCHDLGVPVALIQARLRSGDWRARCRGVYEIWPDTGELLTWIRGALLALGPQSAAVLTTAAWLHGITGLPGDPLPLRVSRPRESPRKPRPGVHVHHLTLPPEHLTEVEGVRVTTIARTAADLMRRVGRIHAVSVADSALRLDPSADLRELLRRGRGSARARGWLQLADPRAESPLETRVRLNLLDGRVPPEELQYPIYGGRGQLLGIADFAWPRALLIVEADGETVHSSAKALFRDRRRQNDLANAGWTVLRFTWADTLRPGYVAGTVRDALTVARRRSVSGSWRDSPQAAGHNR